MTIVAALPSSPQRRPSRPRFWLRRSLALLLVAGVGVGAWRLASGGASSGPHPAPPAAAPSTSPASPVAPTASPSEPTAPPLPECTYADAPAERSTYRAWKRTLLDTRFALGRSYVPPGLVSTTQAGFDEDFLVRSLLIDDLAALRTAAASAGSPVALISAYRSYAQQAVLFEQRKEELGQETARRRVARPGHSEHQLGTAVDFKRPGQKDVSAVFATTAQGRWLAGNAWLYGFIMSYPSGARGETCYAYEPWHFRYFGKEMAAEIHESGLTAREYLWKLDHEEMP
jgi:D-alanyl-D-alanine carboxypeptidase